MSCWQKNTNGETDPYYVANSSNVGDYQLRTPFFLIPYLSKRSNTHIIRAIIPKRTLKYAMNGYEKDIGELQVLYSTLKEDKNRRADIKIVTPHIISLCDKKPDIKNNIIPS